MTFAALLAIVIARLAEAGMAASGRGQVGTSHAVFRDAITPWGARG